MMVKGKMDRGIFEMVEIGGLVPPNHLLRKIDAAVDFNHLYEMVEPLYSEDDGRPSVDPVVLFKMVLIQHLYGLTSLRRTAEEVRANIYYRWFLGYTLQEEIPHFSTVSYNFRHRFTEETVAQVFSWILDEVAEAGYLSPRAVFVDGTHIKANANTKKQLKKEVPVAAKHYAKELMEEVNADREAHGKKPFDDDDHDQPPAPPKKSRDNTSKKKLARRKKQKLKMITESVTDPECRLFVKGEHKRQFAYEAHTACDCNGFVLETVVTPGNVHDSVAFDEVYDKVAERFPEMETVVADSAYKTPHICKKVFDDGRVLSSVYKRPQTMKDGHEWWKYVYDDYYDCVICPEYQVLRDSTTNRFFKNAPAGKQKPVVQTLIDRKEVILVNQAEFTARVQAIRQRLYRIALLTLGSEADALEAVDEAVYQALRALKQLRQTEYFETWITRILINACHKELRHRKHFDRGGEEALPDAAGPDDYDKLPLREAVRRLPEDLRNVVILRFFTGYTQAETAESLGVPQGTVATRQRKALALLRLDLGEEAST